MSKSARIPMRFRNVKSLHEKIIHGAVMRTTIPAGLATSGPPLGSMLGVRNINIQNFCNDFNTRTANIKQGVPLPIRVTVKPDRSYNLVIHQPPTSFFLKQAAGITKAARLKDIAGKVTLKHVYEIAQIKLQDPPNEATDLEDMCNAVIGQARTMGIEVVKHIDPKEYAEFLEERKVVVAEQQKELQAIREAKMLRAA